MARVIRTPQARRDLRHIGRYVAQHSGSAEIAARLLRTISERCQIFATQPLIGEECAELGAAVRRFSAGNYVVYYQPVRDGIELLRILHGARDIDRAWDEE